MSKDISIWTGAAIGLLQELVAIPSFSREESETASHLTSYLFQKGVEVTRVGNNVMALNRHFDPARPTLLLNSHHDTVKPNSLYTRDPFTPAISEGKLYGLGSNDAGGPLVALLQTFLYFHDAEGLHYNLAFAATAEEEISGTGGIQMLLPYLPPIEAAIIGEPTGMQMAIAERGLLVLDGLSTGKAGHAARDEGVNALYLALEDIRRLQAFTFDKTSELLGPVQVRVTAIETSNKAHNVVPADCRFTVDVRVNECYRLEEVAEMLQAQVSSTLTPRSLRIRPSFISPGHPLVQAGLRLGRQTYGSPTTSDKALVPFPALKMGPGDSARSHSADEFIYTEEIREGIALYVQLLNQLVT